MSHSHSAAHGHDASGHSGNYVHHPHVLPVRVYLGVLGSLVVLTAITVGVSYFDFGEWNLIVAMAVASFKASLVALFFMHLKYDERFNSVIFLSAFVFLSLFFIFTLADITRRGEVDPLERGTIEVLPKSSIPPEGGGHGEAGGHGGAPGDGHGAAPAGDHGAAPAGADSLGHDAGGGHGTPAGHDTTAPGDEQGEAAPPETTSGGH